VIKPDFGRTALDYRQFRAGFPIDPASAGTGSMPTPPRWSVPGCCDRRA
jgi:hypothetical protein